MQKTVQKAIAINSISDKKMCKNSLIPIGSLYVGFNDFTDFTITEKIILLHRKFCFNVYV